MVTWFSIVFAFVIMQRLFELLIAKRNGRHMVKLGGFEVGGAHYKYIVLLHAAFFAALFLEVFVRGHESMTPYGAPFALFCVAQGLRVWVLLSLGKFWNTRIYVLPGSAPVTGGPYRFMRHPNYVVVALELFTLPLAFGAWLTALLFTALNALVLRVRIRAEEQALIEVTAYAEAMGGRERFLPTLKK
ncbi:methyltransferase [Tumebacillus sp. BK434]|uniref:isoprenylcysteine carboxyl methyltransferase family protein n=1 Tax=Tumebacillus sp. BK434 TaxID=2512169 RepID=UPI001052E0FA|nr:isoprenylcysteine carboxylmethyltransferase family protein [Tumebacillus sp. BK434]TCP58316.1 methyltransferase [Tumebacillus sp. BK434]